MAIPDVPLNVDRRGYAGPIAQNLSTPNAPGPLTVPSIGTGKSPIYGLLQRMAGIKEAIAKAQLEQMKLRNAGARRDLAQPFGSTGAQRQQLNLRPSNVNVQPGNPWHAADALLSGPRAYREPGDAMKLGTWLNYIGPQAAHRGLMQTGQMLGSRQADPRGELYSAQADALRSQTPGYTPYNYALGNPTMTASPYVQGRGNQFEQGSLPGRVPKTGKAKIHEGEVVVSADQADDDLVQFLTWDKMRKIASGQMDGKGTGPGAKGYAEGSLPRWPGYGEASKGMPAGAELEFVNYVSESGDKEMGEAILEGWGSKKDTVKIRPITNGAPDPSTIEIPAKSIVGKLGKRLSGALQGMVGGVDALLDPMFGLIQNQPEGQEALRSIGLGFLAGDDEEQTFRKGSLPEYQRGSMEYPEGALEREDILALMRGLPPQMGGEPPVSTGQPFGPGSEMEDFGRLLEAMPGLSRFFQPQEDAPPFPSYGLGGPEPVAGGEDVMSPIPPEISQPMMPPPSGPMGPPVPPEVRGQNAYQQSLEQALGRVQGGDLGSPESPLTLEGGGRGPLVRGDEGLPPEMRQFAPEEPSWRQAQHEKTMATLNRQKADRILDYLSREGTGIDPDMRKNLMDQAGYLDKLADTAEKRQDMRRKQYQVVATETDKILGRIEQERTKAAAAGEKMTQERRAKLYDDASDHYNRLQRDFIDKMETADDEQLQAYIRSMARTYTEMQQMQGQQVNPQEAEVLIQYDLGLIDEDEAKEMLAALGG